ncbi:hypothetical protein [Microcoleus sp. F4-D5]|uniref:hypothetical protein n=1 Tax=Microcoleus sp. F4-D5 TaxID=2818760 RepID=UPI002FD0E811
MTVREANQLLADSKATQDKLLECLEDLSKEYGYIQGMTIANLRDLVAGKKTLAEIQELIDQLKQKLKSLK